MKILKYLQSYIGRAVAFFCIGFFVFEPINFTLWAISGVFIALGLIDHIFPSDEDDVR